MLKFILAIAIAFVVMSCMLVPEKWSYKQYAGTAFFSHEVPTGSTKQCVYTYIGGTYTMTVSATSICPLTISV